MATSCMLPNNMTFWKRQNYRGNKKDQWLPGACGEKKELVVHRGFLGQWKCLVWFQNKDYMSLFISHNTENIQLKTEPKVGSGCLWYVDQCLSVVIDISHCGCDTDGGSFECVWRGYMWTLCTFHSALCEPKTLSNNLKKNLFQNRVLWAKDFPYNNETKWKLPWKWVIGRKILTHFRIV